MNFREFFRHPAGILAVLMAVWAFLCAVIWLSGHFKTPCYRSTMGNPDQVVELSGHPFACTNELNGYRCVKMEACEP